MYQHDQQQQETLERERFETEAMRLVEDALLGEDPEYTAWLDSQTPLDGGENGQIGHMGGTCDA